MGRPPSHGRSGSSGRWVLLALFLLAALGASALVVRRVSVLEANRDFVNSTWRELHAMHGRRLELLENLAQAPEGQRAARGLEGGGIERARALMTETRVSPGAAPETQEELEAYLAAQERIDGMQGRFVGEVRRAIKGAPSEGLARLRPELDAVQKRIELAHRDYYDAVSKYNASILAFPEVFLAALVSMERVPAPPVRLIGEAAEEAAPDAAAFFGGSGAGG